MRFPPRLAGVLFSAALLIAAVPSARGAGLPSVGALLIAAAPTANPLIIAHSALWLAAPPNRPTRLPGAGQGGAVTGLTRSPAGSHIAYVLNGTKLLQAAADGSHAMVLYALSADSFGQIAAPRYTPDGKSIGFSAGAGTNFTTYEIAVDGTHLHKLFGGGVRLLQDWSPDGKHLLFTLNGALWTADPSGGHAQPLGGDAPDAGGFSDARYSPDGSHITAALRPAQGVEEAAGQIIVLLHPDGQYLTTLTGHLGYDAAHPTWSPDGKQIAFLVASGALGSLGRLHDLWVMGFNGSNSRNLSRGTAGDVSAAAWAR
jgi:Tol biopolymer transport system component